tara:strand:- start:658 stop:867 length:210 start_codon:yes stop_codon:yes gene_type:complete
MMIELANRINYLEDKLKDLKSKEETLLADIAGLKQRLGNLEYHMQAINSGGFELIDEADEIVENYGGSK